MTLIDDQGRPVALGAELGRGGEGAVYAIAGRPDRVAKIYTKAMPSDHPAKLAAMAQMASDRLLRIAAMPTEVLWHAPGVLAGFVMHRISGCEPVFKLYLPKTRLQVFPAADWRFLIHTAANVARAFVTVHSAGLVVGDVNHGNLVVGQDTTVRLIDCDSFQLSQAGKTWFCGVGVGDYQPPEMQNRASYNGILRSPNTDHFGLAVMIFRLLCLGRHPFSGVYPGADDSPSIEEAIAASRYVYGGDQARTRMRPPPASLPVEALTPDLRRLFDMAFSASTTLGGRPTPEQWIAALEALSKDLAVCPQNKGHFFRKGFPSCPFCAIERATRLTLFPLIGPQNAGRPQNAGPSQADEAASRLLWQEVAGLAPPPALGPFPALPVGRADPALVSAASSHHVIYLRLASYVAVPCAALISAEMVSGGWGLVVLLGLSALVMRDKTPQYKGFREAAKRLTAEWVQLRERWEKIGSDKAFLPLQATLIQLQKQKEQIEIDRKHRLHLLQETCREKQREAFLRRFDIATASIPGIGVAKTLALARMGIKTASDLSHRRICSVPGFGQAMAVKLMGWRANCESGFRFDPARDIPAQDEALIEREYRSRKTAVESQARDGLARLKTMTDQTVAAHNALLLHVRQVSGALAQAKANAQMTPRNTSVYLWVIALSLCVAFVSWAQTGALTHRAGQGLTVTGPQSAGAPQEAAGSANAPVQGRAQQDAPAQDPLRLAEQALTPSDATHELRLACPPSAHSGRMVVMSQNANIHAWPGGPNIGIATLGTRYAYCAEQGHWTEIGDERPLGWVYTPLTRPD